MADEDQPEALQWFTPEWANALLDDIKASRDPAHRDALAAELRVRTDMHALEATHALQRDLAAQAKVQADSLKRASWGLLWATVGLVAVTIALIVVTAVYA